MSNNNLRSVRFGAVAVIIAVAIFAGSADTSYAIEEVPETGSITVCKLLSDATGASIVGEAGSEFAVTLTKGAFSHVATFQTPLVFDTQIFSETNDAQCQTFADLEMGDWAYAPEVVTSPFSFEAPRYSDQLTGEASSVDDLFTYDVLDGNGDDADGSIVLIPEFKNRLLIVYNKLMASQEVSCPEGQHLVEEVCVSDVTVLAMIVIVKHAIGGNDSFDFTIDGEESLSTTTIQTEGGYGTSTIQVEPGSHDVTESVTEGWNLTGIACLYDDESTGAAIENGKTIEIDAGDTVTCTFTNSKALTDQNNGGGEQSTTPPASNGPITTNGPILGSFGFFGGGSVLGASTTNLPNLPAGCDALLTSYMRQGKRSNDPAQVRALQEFLNKHLGLNIPVTGFFGPATTAGVKQFQLTHAEQILAPWGITAPTGFVYKTTQRWINLAHCSSLTIPMPDLTPYVGE